ncbi:protein of unknown function [Paraburkholderia kururiensis]
MAATLTLLLTVMAIERNTRGRHRPSARVANERSGCGVRLRRQKKAQMAVLNLSPK